MAKRKPRHKTQSAHRPIPPQPAAKRIELETAHGLEDIATKELRERYGEKLASKPQTTHGAVRFDYLGPLSDFETLRTIQAAYLRETYAIPRPKAFLGHQHLTQLAAQIAQAQSVHGPDAYTTIHLGAAGSHTAVMQRLLAEMAAQTGLTPSNDDGDLLVRVRPAAGRDSGWDALVRLSPRPVGARAWRVVNMPGALNGAVAHSMVRLSEPKPDDIVLNMMCGSGTLMIERLLHSEAAQVIGCDIDPSALDAARKNIAAANVGPVELTDWNATDVPLRSASIDVIYADLPFGNLVGTHKDNLRLYPAMIDEATRLLRRDGRFIFITHEIKLIEEIFITLKRLELVSYRRIVLSGLTPAMFVLRKS